LVRYFFFLHCSKSKHNVNDILRFLGPRGIASYSLFRTSRLSWSDSRSKRSRHRSVIPITAGLLIA
jgi:hypothetical protein